MKVDKIKHFTFGMICISNPINSFLVKITSNWMYHSFLGILLIVLHRRYSQFTYLWKLHYFINFFCVFIFRVYFSYILIYLWSFWGIYILL